VGTVHFAVASEKGVCHTVRYFPYERQRIKLISAYVALSLVLRCVTQSEIASDEDFLIGRWVNQESQGQSE
jgi:hypothetical protein